MKPPSSGLQCSMHSGSALRMQLLGTSKASACGVVWCGVGAACQWLLVSAAQRHVHLPLQQGSRAAEAVKGALCSSGGVAAALQGTSAAQRSMKASALEWHSRDLENCWTWCCWLEEPSAGKHMAGSTTQHACMPLQQAGASQHREACGALHHHALAADHLVLVELPGQNLKRGLDDATTKPEHQVQGGLLLDVIVSLHTRAVG